LSSARPILLVEDNPDDETLALRAFGKMNIPNPVVVAHDGVDAIDYLLCRGAFSDRDPNVLPAVVLLDLKLPRIDGLEVLRRIRADARTAVLPVVVLTTSRESLDIARPTASAPTATSASRSISNASSRRSACWASTGSTSTRPSPRTPPEAGRAQASSSRRMSSAIDAGLVSGA